MLNNLLLAFSFLTILPISINSESKDMSLARAMVYFPLVGACIAAISLCVFHFLEPLTSERFASLMLVLLPIILSGGLHVDGLADCFDAFFQGKSKEDILTVMKDSRIGVWGALSVIFMVCLKWELLFLLDTKWLGFMLALSLSRWAHVVISYFLPYAREEQGLGAQVAAKVTQKELTLSSLFVAAIAIFLGLKGIIVLCASWSLIYVLSLFYKKRIGGITGDVIGATGEITETVALLSLVILGF